MPLPSSNHDRVRIGAFIAQLREQRGITQQQLARMLRTSQSAVARMESGEQNFSTAMLAKVSRALNRDVISLGTGSMNFFIEGGHALHGSVVTNTAKNSAMGLLCATLLNRQPTVIESIAKIEEVNRMLEVLTSIGVGVRWLNDRDVEITPPKKIRFDRLNQVAAGKTRSVLMLLGPLIHLLPNFTLPHPGGCKLGKRTIRPHVFALEDLGVKIKTGHDLHHVSHGRLHPAEVILYESGDTTTENLLMAAAKIPGTTTIKYASANYMVQDLCQYLIALGVAIEGVGTTTLTVHGNPDLNRRVTFRPSEDPTEAMFFIAIAATTNSAITIKRCPIEFLELELLKLKKMGWRYTMTRPYRSSNGFTKLVDIRTHLSKLTALEEKIYARPYPGLNIDNLPFFVPLATQAVGTTLIHDWVYENRAIYYLELNKLGANILLADPHRVYIEGPTPFKAGEIICPPALRPAAIIMIAMLAAPGPSILRNVYSINRGYEDICARLAKLGAKIRILTDL